MPIRALTRYRQRAQLHDWASCAARSMAKKRALTTAQAHRGRRMMRSIFAGWCALPSGLLLCFFVARGPPDRSCLLRLPQLATPGTHPSTESMGRDPGIQHSMDLSMRMSGRSWCASAAVEAAEARSCASAVLQRKRLRRQLQAWAALPKAAAGQRYRRALAHSTALRHGRGTLSKVWATPLCFGELVTGVADGFVMAPEVYCRPTNYRPSARMSVFSFALSAQV